MTIPRRQYSDLKATINVDKSITAPVKEGEKFGTVSVTLKDEVVTTSDLVALKSIDKGNIFQRLYDEAVLLVEKKQNEK